MDLYTARQQYIADLKRRGRSTNTIVSAERVLSAFDVWSDSVIGGAHVTDLVTATVEHFLYDRGHSPATFNRYRSVLKDFFTYCWNRGWYTGKNPADQVPPMKAAPEQPHLILTPAQMLQMLDNANPVERIALAVGMNTGLRASDIAALKVGDVDLSALTLRTKIQKTGGYDEKPITTELHRELARWLTAYERSVYGAAGALDNNWYLVPSYTWQRGTLAPDQLYPRPTQSMTHLHRIVQRALLRIGVVPNVGEGFHTLRRSSARALFEKLRGEGMSLDRPFASSFDHALLVVKEFLNHKSIEQTQHYLGINHERQIRDEMLRGKSFLSSSLSTTTSTGCTYDPNMLLHLEMGDV